MPQHISKGEHVKDVILISLNIETEKLVVSSSSENQKCTSNTPSFILKDVISFLLTASVV